jgi:hypothetical protein
MALLSIQIGTQYMTNSDGTKSSYSCTAANKQCTGTKISNSAVDLVDYPSLFCTGCYSYKYTCGASAGNSQIYKSECNSVAALFTSCPAGEICLGNAEISSSAYSSTNIKDVMCYTQTQVEEYHYYCSAQTGNEIMLEKDSVYVGKVATCPSNYNCEDSSKTYSSEKTSSYLTSVMCEQIVILDETVDTNDNGIPDTQEPEIIPTEEKNDTTTPGTPATASMCLASADCKSKGLCVAGEKVATKCESGCLPFFTKWKTSEFDGSDEESGCVANFTSIGLIIGLLIALKMFGGRGKQ